MVWAGLDAGAMDAVESDVQCRYKLTLMTRTNEQITLDGALARERVDVVPGDPVANQEHPGAMPH